MSAENKGVISALMGHLLLRDYWIQIFTSYVSISQKREFIQTSLGILFDLKHAQNHAVEVPSAINPNLTKTLRDSSAPRETLQPDFQDMVNALMREYIALDQGEQLIYTVNEHPSAEVLRVSLRHSYFHLQRTSL